MLSKKKFMKQYGDDVRKLYKFPSEAEIVAMEKQQNTFEMSDPEDEDEDEEEEVQNQMDF